ncbi:MAG: tetratricopeptide repeat protein, partial [Dysgonamonadaceae bacterium]|nr:tetratricopeptide repeat protein [Dysgonamonadaceae bacterium]
MKVENNWGLSAYGSRCLAYCYFQNNQWEECLQVCKRWIREYDKENDDTEKSFIYGFMAGSYNFGLEDYKQAILWYQKTITIVEKINGTGSAANFKYLLADC